MKKKIIIIIPSCLIALIITIILLKSISTVNVEYPVYEKGTKVYLDSKQNSECDIRIKTNCKEYIVMKTSGKKEKKIKVIDKNSNTKKLEKLLFVKGYLIKATQETNIGLYYGDLLHLEDKYLFKQKGITKVVFFNNYDDIVKSINNAEKYDHIFSIQLQDNDIKSIKKDTFVTTNYISTENLIVDGNLTAEKVFIPNLSGTGMVNLSYTYTLNSDKYDDIIYDASRFYSEKVSGIKINILGCYKCSGTPFGYFGLYKDNETAKNNEQKIKETIKMYNSVLDPEIGEIVLATYGPDDKKYYYGMIIDNKNTE